MATAPVFEWDEGNWPKCGKHGLSREEIEGFFRQGPAFKPDPHGGEERLRAIGRTEMGRYAFVVFTLRRREGVTTIRPVSARYMHRKEVQRYGSDNAQAAPDIRER